MAWSKNHQGPRAARGYGYAHGKLRAALLPSAYGKPCSRCGLLMLPGQELHLDHDDYDRTKYRGFSHKACNLKAAARMSNMVAKLGRVKINKPAHRW